VSPFLERTDAPAAAPSRSAVRKAVGLGIVLLAVGVTLSLWASSSARHEPVAPFSYGLHLFIPVRGGEQPPQEPGAEGQPAPAESADAPDADARQPQASSPPGGRRTIEVEADYQALGPEEQSAIAEALEGADVVGPLPVRWTHVILWTPVGLAGRRGGPGDGSSGPRACALAVVADADADRWLDPLVPEPNRGAGAYVGAAEDLKDLLAETRFASGAADLKAAALPLAADVLEDFILLRPEAAARLGLEQSASDPNVAILALRRPGSLEDAMRRAWPLWKKYGMWMRPVDLRVARGTNARWVGLGALVAMLAGGTLLLGTGLTRLARLPTRGRTFRDMFVGAARLAADRPKAYALASALVVAAMTAGAAGGWPEALAVPGEAGGGAPGLGMVGLSAVPMSAAAMGMVLVSQVAGRVLRVGFLMGIPALVPGVGWLVILAQQVLRGMALEPATLVLLDRLPLRAGVAALEVQAAALLLVGAAEVWRGIVRPEALGCETRREGYTEAVRRVCRLAILALVISGAAAVVETLFIAAVTHSA